VILLGAEANAGNNAFIDPMGNEEMMS